MPRESDLIMVIITITGRAQADRLLNLLEMFEIENESGPLRFTVLADHLAERGIKLGRSSWDTIKDPEYRYNRVRVLAAIALFFGEDQDFLIKEETQPSERYKSRLEAARKKASKKFALAFCRQSIHYSDEALASNVLRKFVDLINEERQLGVKIICKSTGLEQEA